MKWNQLVDEMELVRQAVWAESTINFSLNLIDGAESIKWRKVSVDGAGMAGGTRAHQINTFLPLSAHGVEFAEREKCLICLKCCEIK